MSDAPPTRPRRWLDPRILPLLAITGLVLWLVVDRMAGVEEIEAAFRGADLRFVALALGLALVQPCSWRPSAGAWSFARWATRCPFAGACGPCSRPSPWPC